MARTLAPAYARHADYGRISRHVVDVDRLSNGMFEVLPDVAGAVHPHYRHRAARAFDRVPGRMRPALLRSHVDSYLEGGESAALVQLDAVRDAWGGRGLSVSATDDDIREYAEQRAEWVHGRLYASDGPLSGAAGFIEKLRSWVSGVLALDGLTMPDAELPGLLARITSARWWRRKLRSVVMRRLEGAAVRAGMVHIRAGIYASDETVVRRGRAARRNAAALDAATATNEAGQEFTLSELSAVNVSNPEVRRMEMMTRVRGVEEVADNRGWSAYFATWTCPSRFHARLSRSGAINPAYARQSPKEAQGYLTRLWAKARAAIARRGIGMMGIRVAEPHHDGTPHWHLLVFCRRADADVVRDVMRGYALEDSPSEPGAEKHRFSWKWINRATGSAVGYIAKYIAKSIDGMAVDGDLDTGAAGAQETGLSGVQGAERAIVWARAWGVRQFQFFGVPAIGPWRELRRVRALPAEQLSFFDAWNAADLGEFGEYMEAVEKAPIAIKTEARASIYPGEVNQAVTGLIRGAAELLTRVHTWVIKWGSSGEKSAPWTRVNNCTEGVRDGVDRTGGSADGEGAGRAERGRYAVAWGRAGIDPGDVRAAGIAGP